MEPNPKFSRKFVASAPFGMLAALTILVAALSPSVTTEGAQALRRHRSGLVDDWTTHHVVFSNIGSYEDAVRTGTYAKFYRILYDPRYIMQQTRRSAQYQAAHNKTKPPSFTRDWSVSLGGGSVAATMSPAKFTFNPIGTPDCTNDYAVFPINAAGSSTQANIIGFNNLYSGTNPTTGLCGTTPTVKFAYNVGTGTVQTSPVLSSSATDGKMAFVESKAGGAVFHVLTIGTTGANGTSAILPATPGTLNNAVDTKITLSGPVNVTRSPVFVDYGSDTGYVGDDNGKLHKFTGVFNGNPAEAGAPWPITVSAGTILTGPTADAVTNNIFVGSSDGHLYYVRDGNSSAGTCASGSPPCLGSTNVLVTTTGGTGAALLDPPIVDSSTQRVFEEVGFDNSTNCTDASGGSGKPIGCSALVQADTALTAGSVVRVNMGSSNTPNNAHDGAFDNLYFTSLATGHMYFAGYQAGTNDHKTTLTLYRVGFNASGVMNPAHDGICPVDCLALDAGSSSDVGAEASPLTEFFNTNTLKDWLFMGIGPGATTGVVENFDITTTFPAAAAPTPASESGGTSAIIIDHDSPSAQASSIYFGPLGVHTAVKLTQAGL